MPNRYAIMARRKSKRKPHVQGCCQRGDHRISRPKPQPQPVGPPTEPCPICLEVAGLKRSEGDVESWAALPCGHRFGGHCLKVWLGATKNAFCPYCKKAMLHVCGHPPLPRPAPPPAFDAADIQPGDDRAPSKSAEKAPDTQQEAQDEPEAPEAQEMQGAQRQDEAVGCDQAGIAPSGSVNESNDANDADDANNCQQGSSQVTPKNSVRVAAHRVRSFGGVVRPSRPGEPSSNNNDGAAAASEPPAAPEAANNDQAVVVAPPASQPAPPAATPAAPQPAPPAAPPVAPPVAAPAAAYGSNSNRRHRLRRRLGHGRSQEAYAEPPLPPPAPAPAPPIHSEQVDGYELLASIVASMLKKQPAQMPTYMAMAYPRTVDLTLPCTYCYLNLERKLQESPKRSVRGVYTSSSRIPGKRLAIRGARQVARGSVTIVRAAGSALRFLYHGSGNNNSELTYREEQVLAAYWGAWRQARILTFGQWWAEQAPRSDPAVATSPGNWNLYNLSFN